MTRKPAVPASLSARWVAALYRGGLSGCIVSVILFIAAEAVDASMLSILARACLGLGAGAMIVAALVEAIHSSDSSGKSPR